jgi:hypothetical protein
MPDKHPWILTISLSPAPGKPGPSLAEQLAVAGDDSQPLFVRLQAAEDAAFYMHCELERKVEAIFPDWYWDSDSIFGSDGERVVALRLAKKMDPDGKLTPERRKALVDLGVNYFGDERLD